MAGESVISSSSANLLTYLQGIAGLLTTLATHWTVGLYSVLKEYSKHYTLQDGKKTQKKLLTSREKIIPTIATIAVMM